MIKKFNDEISCRLKRGYCFLDAEESRTATKKRPAAWRTFDMGFKDFHNTSMVCSSY